MLNLSAWKRFKDSHPELTQEIQEVENLMIQEVINKVQDWGLIVQKLKRLVEQDDSINLNGNPLEVETLAIELAAEEARRVL